MNEAASHAVSAERRDDYQTLEQQARALFGKQSDAIQAHLVIEAGRNITPQDDGQATHHTWISSFALARATTLLYWAFQRIERLELEASGQETLFDEDAD
jgi:hypothetical protein